MICLNKACTTNVIYLIEQVLYFLVSVTKSFHWLSMDLLQKATEKKLYLK